MESLLSASASCIDEENCYESSNNLTNSTNDNLNNNSLLNNNSNSTTMNSSKRRLSPNRLRAKYIAEIEEIRINSIVSKKGFLNFLEEKSIGWSKRFVVLIDIKYFFNFKKFLIET
jgi:hypothetical protein